MMNIVKYPDFNIEGVVEEYGKSISNKSDDLINYRDKGGFKSNITGQISCNGNKKWI
jgi:hypothetical protein